MKTFLLLPYEEEYEYKYTIYFFNLYYICFVRYLEILKKKRLKMDSVKKSKEN